MTAASLVVVHDQHGARRGGCRRERGGRRHRDPRQRQSCPELRAMTGAFARELQAAAVQFRDLARHREPDAQAAAERGSRLVAAHEHVEDALARHGRDAGPVVADVDRRIAVLGRRAEADAPAGRRVAGGIGQQVHQELGEPPGVALHHQGQLRQLDGQRVRLLVEQRAHGLDGGGHHLGEVDGDALDREFAARDARHVEDVLDDVRELGGLALEHRAHRRLRRMVERQPRHHVDGAADGRQRVAQLVRKHRDEFRHLLRRLLERLDVPAVREVLRDLGEAVEALLAVVERGDDHARPEALAALAQAPALRFGAAGAPRRRELFPWHRRAILLRVEAREMLAQDLAARVPGDALGAGVPAGDAAVHVQHVDRVVGHALHQQPEALLALAQRFLVRPPPGEVAGDLGKAQRADRRGRATR